MPTPPLPNCPGPGPHDGGGALGPLKVCNNGQSPPYDYACPACWAASGVAPDGELPWPQNDILSTNP
jgi:hypothetical protein